MFLGTQIEQRNVGVAWCRAGNPLCAPTCVALAGAQGEGALVVLMATGVRRVPHAVSHAGGAPKPLRKREEFRLMGCMSVFCQTCPPPACAQVLPARVVEPPSRGGREGGADLSEVAEAPAQRQPRRCGSHGGCGSGDRAGARAREVSRSSGMLCVCLGACGAVSGRPQAPLSCASVGGKSQASLLRLRHRPKASPKSTTVGPKPIAIRPDVGQFRHGTTPCVARLAAIWPRRADCPVLGATSSGNVQRAPSLRGGCAFPMSHSRYVATTAVDDVGCTRVGGQLDIGSA